MVLILPSFCLEHIGQSKNSEGPRSKRGVKDCCYVCVGREQGRRGARELVSEIRIEYVRQAGFSKIGNCF